ncbi:MAG: DUF4832 domain-containing protein, partial [Clostridium sp.]
ICERVLESAEKPADNPLSGFVSWEDGEGTDFPHSMEYYAIPLNHVQKGYHKFDWAELEECLDKAQENGNQAVIRFYLDNPGSESGIPEFLLRDGLETYEYDLDGSEGFCPDYTDENLKKALKSFIKKFGEKYDGDPRIGFIECGLLGFWGEWHTYPYDEWYPDKKIYNAIGNAFTKSFTNTKLLAGEIVKNITPMEIGYHDDMFVVDTSYFNERLNEVGAKNKWKTAPIGGELAPEIQDTVFENDSEEFKESADLIHLSWCLNSEIVNYSGEEKDNAIDAASHIGYDFNVGKVSFSKAGNDSFKLNLEIKNKGTAPFYYPWEVEVRITDGDGEEIAREITSWDLTSIKQLNKTYKFKHKFNNIHLDENDYFEISMRVINPMEGGKNLMFSNEGQEDDGWLYLIEK